MPHAQVAVRAAGEVPVDAHQRKPGQNPQKGPERAEHSAEKNAGVTRFRPTSPISKKPMNQAPAKTRGSGAPGEAARPASDAGSTASNAG